MSIIGECRGWDLETNPLSEMQEHRALFPRIPEQSRFNRRLPLHPPATVDENSSTNQAVYFVKSFALAYSGVEYLDRAGKIYWALTLHR